MPSVSIPEGLVAELRAVGQNPTDLVLYVNSGCNLRCLHCYVGTPLLDEALYYSLPSILQLLHELPPLDRITVLGGEPFFHPNLTEIIAAVEAHSCRERRVTTNLTVLKDNILDSLKRSSFRICVSLEGHLPKLHDAIRGEGAFMKTTTNLREVLERDFDVEVTHTITSSNVDYFWEFVQYCKRIGLKRLNLHRISLRGNALANPQLDVSATRWRSLTTAIEAQAKSTGDLKIRYEVGFATQAEYERLVQSGEYQHHTHSSFYSTGGGGRIVIFPDQRIYISSEAFGTNSHIGDISSGKFVFNDSPDNELIASQNPAYSTTNINQRVVGDQRYPIPLSVSYRKAVRI